MVSTRLLGGAGVEYRGLAAVATLLPTLVWTPWTRETLATFSIADFVATILFVLLDAFLGFAFCMKIILHFFLGWPQIIDRDTI